MTKFKSLFPTHLLSLLCGIALIMLIPFSIQALAFEQSARTIPLYQPGDPLPRISCGEGRTASVLSADPVRPDTLIFDASGNLVYSDEGNNTINRYNFNDGSTETIASGFNNPEGITFDDQGNLYVVEDVRNGRLLKIEPNGTETVLMTDLEYSEGLTYGKDGLLYLSTSAADTALQDPPEDQADLDENYRGKIFQVDPANPAGAKVILNTKPQYETTIIDTQNADVVGAFYSYTGLSTGNDGKIYFTNELSGFDVITQTTVPNPLPFLPPVTLNLHFTSTESIFVLDPANLPADPESVPEPIHSDLIAPEGTYILPGSASQSFPIYVAEAMIPDGDPSRLVKANEDG